MPQPCPVCYEPTSSTTLCRACMRGCPRDTSELELVIWAVKRARKADRKRARLELEQRCLTELHRLTRRGRAAPLGHLVDAVAWPSHTAAKRAVEKLIAAGLVERGEDGLRMGSGPRPGA